MSIVPSRSMDESEYESNYDEPPPHFRSVPRQHLLDDSLIDPRLLNFPPQCNVADVQGLDLQGVDSDSTFATTLNKPHSALVDRIRTIIKGNIFLEGRNLGVTPGQVVTAALLTFRGRAATKAKLIERISTWVEFAPWCRHYGIDRVLKPENEFGFHRNSKSVGLLRSVNALLDRAAQDFDTNFPPKKYFPPTDPTKRSEWWRKMRAEITTQEGDVEGKMKRFHYKYEHDIDWVGGFIEERILALHEGRAPFRTSDLYLPPLMENNIFSTFLENEWTADYKRTFNRWADLPLRVERQAVVSPKDRFRNERIEYRPLAKVPRCLVSRDGSAGLASKLSCFYWSLGLPEDVLQARLVNQEFSSAIRGTFFKKNMFGVHDHIPALFDHCMDRIRYPNTVAHDWLKRTSELGLLNQITQLNIDLTLRRAGQNKTQFHQICVAAASMGKLRRLVVTLNMECFKDDDASPDDVLDPEVDFHRPTCQAPLAWPGILPLVWAKTGVGRSPKLKIFFPQNRKIERLAKHRMDMDDNNPKKVWAETEWDSPTEDWATADIAASIADVRTRQQPYQERTGEVLYQNIYKMDFEEDADDYRTAEDDCSSDSNDWDKGDDEIAKTIGNHGEDVGGAES